MNYCVPVQTISSQAPTHIMSLFHSNQEQFAFVAIATFFVFCLLLHWIYKQNYDISSDG